MLRYIFIYLLKKFGQFDQVWERAVKTKVGSLGFVLEEEKKANWEQGVKPLNSFELWLLNPLIKKEKEFIRKSIDIKQEIFPL